MTTTTGRRAASAAVKQSHLFQIKPLINPDRRTSRTTVTPIFFLPDDYETLVTMGGHDIAMVNGPGHLLCLTCAATITYIGGGALPAEDLVDELAHHTDTQAPAEVRIVETAILAVALGNHLPDLLEWWTPTRAR